MATDWSESISQWDHLKPHDPCPKCGRHLDGGMGAFRLVCVCGWGVLDDPVSQAAALPDYRMVTDGEHNDGR